MKSMTGYGKCVVSKDNRELTVELKSVNHRFLDVSSKMPRAFLAHEDLIRSVLSQYVSRGHVDVFVNYRLVSATDKVVRVDLALAREYAQAAEQLHSEFPALANDFTVGSLMRSGDVLSLEQATDNEDETRSMLFEALHGAARSLNEMREVEGNKLRSDLLGKISVLEQLLQKVKEEAPLIAESYREKLRARVQAALQEVEIDQSKLANEVCFFVDKSSIDEEITRLTTHISHSRQILASEEPVGRKLDFLVQEFNRETNTICSKSNSTALTAVALDMKNEIEKIREQIQNIE